MKYGFKEKTMWKIIEKSFIRSININCKDKNAKEIIKKSKFIYKEIIETTPSIGKRNKMVMNLYAAAILGAIYKTMDKKPSIDTMTNLFKDGMLGCKVYKFYVKHFICLFSKKAQNKRYKMSLKSKKNNYQFDWQNEFIFGKTVNEYGMNFTKCGICELYKKENIVELIPAMCAFDFTMAETMGAKLTRNHTLAEGYPCCDFWYKKKI